MRRTKLLFVFLALASFVTTPLLADGSNRLGSGVKVPRKLKRRAKADDAEERIEAYKELRSRGENGIRVLRQIFDERQESAEEDLLRYVKRKRRTIWKMLAVQITQRRKKAYAFIMDPASYPNANHGAAAQDDVDRLVDALRVVYSDPYRYLVEEKKVERIVERVDELKTVLSERETWTDESGDWKAVETDIRQKVADIIEMERIPVSRKHKKILSKSRKILRYNERVRTSLNDEERDCIRRTNEYRMMFGLLPLKIDERLNQAARKHSAEMKRLDFFDHYSPVPENRTPEQRVKREGATYSGENIAFGYNTGKGAFHGWYTSSGHHRNMLDPMHETIGVGQHDTHWTQNFGLDD